MAEYTTVRLTVPTRDDVKRLAAENGLSADQLIADALAAYRWEKLRKEAELEAHSLSSDPAYRDEVAAAIRDLSGHDA